MNPLDAVNFDEITIEDVKKLQEYAYPEGKDIDYKRKLSLFPEEGEKNTDVDKRRLEFLRDVSSFANTHGGYLLFGIEEEEKIPTAMPGFKVDDTEKLEQRIEQLLQTGVNPKIQGIRLRWVDLDDKNRILLVKIPNSWNPPHMVTANGYNRFDARNSMGKYFMDVEDLRMAFTQAALINESFMTFRQQRIDLIAKNEGICPLPNSAKIVIHLLPFSFSKEPNLLDFSRVNSQIENFSPFNEYVQWAIMHNFFGVASIYGGTPNEVTSYNQWFRNGGFEIADTYILSDRSDNKSIPQAMFEGYFIKWLQRSLILMQNNSVPAPYCLMLSMLGLKDFQIHDGSFIQRSSDRRKVTMDNLLFPPVMIPDGNVEAEKVLHPVFDWVWNSAGYPNCFNYNQEGKWIGDKSRGFTLV
jgi:hypothetical protein